MKLLTYNHQTFNELHVNVFLVLIGVILLEKTVELMPFFSRNKQVFWLLGLPQLC